MPTAGTTYSQLQADCAAFDLVLQLEADSQQDRPVDPFGPPPDHPDSHDRDLFVQIGAHR